MGALQFAHDAVELFQSAIDVQRRRFGIRRQKQREPMLADLECALWCASEPAMWTRGRSILMFSIRFAYSFFRVARS